jgi:hypothetical protein
MWLQSRRMEWNDTDHNATKNRGFIESWNQTERSAACSTTAGRRCDSCPTCPEALNSWGCCPVIPVQCACFDPYLTPSPVAVPAADADENSQPSGHVARLFSEEIASLLAMLRGYFRRKIASLLAMLRGYFRRNVIPPGPSPQIFYCGPLVTDALVQQRAPVVYVQPIIPARPRQWTSFLAMPRVDRL